jgi:hypothetical protein
VAGYLLVATLLVNMLVLFAIAHLPGQQRVSLSSASDKACTILLKMLGAGLVVWFRALLKALSCGWAQVQALVLWLAVPGLRAA